MKIDMFNNFEELTEEIILTLADIVMENRELRYENDRLKEVEKKYYEDIDRRCKESEQATRNMINALFCGVAVGSGKEEDKKFAEHLCETGMF